MFAIRNLLRGNQQIVKNVVQPRNMSGIAVPPRSTVTKGEIIVLAGSMVFAWLSIPAWVLLNIKNYRSKE